MQAASPLNCKVNKLLPHPSHQQWFHRRERKATSILIGQQLTHLHPIFSWSKQQKSNCRDVLEVDSSSVSVLLKPTWWNIKHVYLLQLWDFLNLSSGWPALQSLSTSPCLETLYLGRSCFEVACLFCFMCCLGNVWHTRPSSSSILVVMKPFWSAEALM